MEQTFVLENETQLAIPDIKLWLYEQLEKHLKICYGEDILDYYDYQITDVKEVFLDNNIAKHIKVDFLILCTNRAILLWDAEERLETGL